MSETANSLADLETLGADVQAPVQIAAVVREQEIDAQGRAYATGRRKDAVARVWLKPGTGKIVVNGRDQEVYFARPSLRLVINQPFGVTERTGQYDVIATVKGGGLSGQAGAVKHGIAQALSKYEPLLRSAVKSEGFLTREKCANAETPLDAQTAPASSMAAHPLSAVRNRDAPDYPPDCRYPKAHMPPDWRVPDRVPQRPASSRTRW